MRILKFTIISVVVLVIVLCALVLASTGNAQAKEIIIEDFLDDVQAEEIILYPWDFPPECPEGYPDCRWFPWNVGLSIHCDGGRRINWLTAPNGKAVFGATCSNMSWLPILFYNYHENIIGIPPVPPGTSTP